jgi:hypothetical protein
MKIMFYVYRIVYLFRSLLSGIVDRSVGGIKSNLLNSSEESIENLLSVVVSNVIWKQQTFCRRGSQS